MANDFCNILLKIIYFKRLDGESWSKVCLFHVDFKNVIDIMKKNYFDNLSHLFIK